MRKEDFYSVMPIDLNAGSCAWYAGLDWSLSHWHPSSPGHKRSSFIACYPGGVEHIGRDSTWQGTYDDEISMRDQLQLRSMSLYDIVKKYPPRHTYVSAPYWYEQLTDNELFLKCNGDDQYDPTPGFDETKPETFPEIEQTKVLAFNYLWPEYGTTFLEDSIQHALEFADKYILLINTKSYIGTPCKLENLARIMKIIEKFDPNQVIAIINAGEHSNDCQQNNIAYYFKQFGQAYESKIRYLWLVQTDEIYDAETINIISSKMDNQEFVGKSSVFTPICYIDTPNWAVTPLEDITRPSLVDMMILKLHNFNTTIIPPTKTDITFHHMSYVMPLDEIKNKFSNWGHRKDVKQANNYFELISRNKTDKSLKDLHPVIPQLYKQVKYTSTSFNDKMFLNYIRSLFHITPNRNNILKLFSKYVNNIEHTDPNSLTNLSQLDSWLLSIIVGNMIPYNGNILDFNSFNTVSSAMFRIMNSGKIYSIMDYNSPESMYSKFVDNMQSIYRNGIRNSLSYNFQLFNGSYKTICALNNNSLDFAFFNTQDLNLLSHAMVEAWPKLRNYSIICGTFAAKPNVKANIIELLTPHQVNCPWGTEHFNYYETYFDLSSTLKGTYPEFSSYSTSGIWFARIKKGE